MEQVLPVLAPAGVQEVVMDAGFIDGAWLRRLHERWGLQLTLRVREDMDLFADALGQTRRRPVLPGEAAPQWIDAPLPKIKKGRRPMRRRVMLCALLESWQSLGLGADALVVEDRFADGEVRYFVVACIGNRESDPLARWRARWAIEELFMVSDRWQGLGRLFPCQEGFARAWVHVAFLAYSLLFLFDRWAKGPPHHAARHSRPAGHPRRPLRPDRPGPVRRHPAGLPRCLAIQAGGSHAQTQLPGPSPLKPVLLRFATAKRSEADGEPVPRQRGRSTSRRHARHIRQVLSHHRPCGSEPIRAAQVVVR